MEGEANEEEILLLARRIKSILTYWGIPAVIASTSQSFFGEAILRVISQRGFWFGISVGIAVGFVAAVATVQLIKKLRPNTAGVGVSIGELMRIIAGGFTKESLFVGISAFFIISVVIGLTNLFSGPVIAGIVGIFILLLILLFRGTGLAESIAANLLSSGIVRADVSSRVMQRYSVSHEFHTAISDLIKDRAEEIDSDELYRMANNWHYAIAPYIDIYEMPLDDEQEATDWLVNKVVAIESVEISEESQRELRDLLAEESQFVTVFKERIKGSASLSER